MMNDPQMNDDAVIARIRAMRAGEETAHRCRDYLTPVIEASCRKAMVDWCLTVCDSFGLDRESVATAMSILDRYICSGKGKSAEALENKQKYQLATITSFYMAVKITEPAQLGIQTVVKLCRGFYKETTFFAMERDILAALEWRVYKSSTSPMEYVRHYLELLPERSDVTNVIIEHALGYAESATADIYFSTCRPSVVAVAILAGAMVDTCNLSPMDKDKMWRQLIRKLDFDVASNEVRKVEAHLLATSTACHSRRESHMSLPRHSVQKSSEHPSSPVSVMQVD